MEKRRSGDMGCMCTCMCGEGDIHMDTRVPVARNLINSRAPAAAAASADLPCSDRGFLIEIKLSPLVSPRLRLIPFDSCLVLLFSLHATRFHCHSLYAAWSCERRQRRRRQRDGK